MALQVNGEEPALQEELQALGEVFVQRLMLKLGAEIEEMEVRRMCSARGINGAIASFRRKYWLEIWMYRLGRKAGRIIRIHR